MFTPRHKPLLDQASPARQVGNAEAFNPAWLDTHQYALLNPLHVMQADRQDLPGQPLATPNTRVREHLLPQLVHLDALSAARREVLVRKIRQYARRGIHFLSALLESDATVDELVWHFRFTLEQARRGSQRRWWFRCHDPRVFRHLCWLLDQEQMSRLLGPVTLWRWPTSTADWPSLSIHQTKSPVINTCLLAEWQWDALDRMALLNTTLDRLAMLAPEQASSFEDYVRLDHLLAEAYSLGLTSVEDRQLYAEQTARFHFRIHEHPDLRQRLETAREQQGGYARLCEDLSPQTMQAMAQELETTS